MANVTSSMSTLLIACFPVIFQRAAVCLQEKEDWINAVGRAIVRHSKRHAPRLVLLVCCSTGTGVCA